MKENDLIESLSEFLPDLKIEKDQYGTISFYINIKKENDFKFSVLSPKKNDDSELKAPHLIKEFIDNYSVIESKIREKISIEASKLFNESWKREGQETLDSKDISPLLKAKSMLCWPETYRCEIMYSIKKDLFAGHSIVANCNGIDFDEIQIGLFG